MNGLGRSGIERIPPRADLLNKSGPQFPKGGPDKDNAQRFPSATTAMTSTAGTKGSGNKLLRKHAHAEHGVSHASTGGYSEIKAEDGANVQYRITFSHIHRAFFCSCLASRPCFCTPTKRSEKW